MQLLILLAIARQIICLSLPSIDQLEKQILSVTMSFISPTTLIFCTLHLQSFPTFFFFSGFISSVINRNLKVWLHRQAGEIRTDGCLYHFIFPQFYQPQLLNEGTSGRLRIEPRGTHVLFPAHLLLGFSRAIFTKTSFVHPHKNLTHNDKY